MAATTTTVYTLDITLLDEYQDSFTFKLDNPVENVTLEQIRAIYAPMIATNKFYARQSSGKVIAVKQAVKTTSTISKEFVS